MRKCISEFQSFTSTKFKSAAHVLSQEESGGNERGRQRKDVRVCLCASVRDIKRIDSKVIYPQPTLDDAERGRFGSDKKGGGSV